MKFGCLYVFVEPKMGFWWGFMRFGLCRKWNLGKFEWDSDELRSRNIGNQMDLVGLSLLVIGNPILGWIVYPYLGRLINGEKYGSKKKKKKHDPSFRIPVLGWRPPRWQVGWKSLIEPSPKSLGQLTTNFQRCSPLVLGMRNILLWNLLTSTDATGWVFTTSAQVSIRLLTPF